MVLHSGGDWCVVSSLGGVVPIQCGDRCVGSSLGEKTQKINHQPRNPGLKLMRVTHMKVTQQLPPFNLPSSYHYITHTCTVALQAVIEVHYGCSTSL